MNNNRHAALKFSELFLVRKESKDLIECFFCEERAHKMEWEGGGNPSPSELLRGADGKHVYRVTVRRDPTRLLIPGEELRHLFKDQLDVVEVEHLDAITINKSGIVPLICLPYKAFYPGTEYEIFKHTLLYSYDEATIIRVEHLLPSGLYEEL